MNNQGINIVDNLLIMDSQLLDFVDSSGKIESLQDEITTITKDLDSYIEKNSERSLEFMKFEAIDRLATFVNQYKNMIESAKRLEQNFLTDPTINTLQDEVKWFQERVQYFENLQITDSKLITEYQNQYKISQTEKKALESQLKIEKNEVIKLKNQLKSQKNSTPVIKSNFQIYQADTSLIIPKSEKEKVDYLKSASKKLKNTLKSVKEEIHKYKTQQFQSRQEFLPIEHFFKDCYKSVYQLIFQRQSQLDDEQLSLAYKMFRENKMEFNEIKHKPITTTSRADSHILREAITLQHEQRLVGIM